MSEIKFKFDICPECKVKEGDSSAKTLYKCQYCERWFCAEHFDPRLAIFRGSEGAIKDVTLRRIIQEDLERKDGHPDYPYTHKRLRELDIEKEMDMKMIESMLDRSKAYKKKILRRQREKRRTEGARTKPRMLKKETKDVLSTYLISTVFTLVGLGIVYWQVHSPALWFLLVFYVIPIPVIIIGLFLFFFGFIATVAIAVFTMKKPSVSMKLLVIPLVFSLTMVSIFGITVFSTMHKTFYIGTDFVNVDYIQDRVFQLINEERLNRNLPALLIDQNLEGIAQSWSEDLAIRNCLEHGNFEARVLSIGYGSYQCGEIIAQRDLSGIGFFQTPLEREFVEGWLESSGHRDIMLTPLTGFLGVGIAKNSNSIYAVADFRFD